MTSLIPASNGLDRLRDRRETKTLDRIITGIEQSTSVGLARIASDAQLEAAKVHAIGFVGQQAMQAVAMVSELEGQLAQACPLATTRLQGIADITALSMAQVVADSARRIGR